MRTKKVKQVKIGRKAKTGFHSDPQCIQTPSSDGPVMYWMKKLDDHRRAKKDMIFGISYHHLDFMVKMFLATHLASSKLIEDRREGQPGDQIKLIPTSPNHPSRKFRIIQLWDRVTRKIDNGATSKPPKTALTPFMTRDARASSQRRWPANRPTPLKVDLVEEARKEKEQFRQLREEVRQYRAQRPPWDQDQDDGLDPLPGETVAQYIARVRPRLHQRW